MDQTQRPEPQKLLEDTNEFKMSSTQDMSNNEQNLHPNYKSRILHSM